MKANEQTIQQINRFLKKVAQKFPATEEDALMTDIHIRVSQESGDLMAFDDEEQELTRCVVEEWIENKDDDFYNNITGILRSELSKNKEVSEHLNIIKPYSYVLEDDDKENIAELYVVDDDTIIIGGDLMEGLDEDLDKFFQNLIKE
ncbi:MAG: hypothetical protein IJV27_07035 [Prevotella sp.]|nr:hypothetical protein [Prevotella sp.]